MQNTFLLNLRLPKSYVSVRAPNGGAITGVAIAAKEIGTSGIWSAARVQLRWSPGPWDDHPASAFAFDTPIELNPTTRNAYVPSRELEGIGAGYLHAVVSTAESAGSTTAMVFVTLSMTLDGPTIQPPGVDGGGP